MEAKIYYFYTVKMQYTSIFKATDSLSELAQFENLCYGVPGGIHTILAWV